MAVQINGDHGSLTTDSVPCRSSTYYPETHIRSERAVEMLTFGDCSEAVLYEQSGVIEVLRGSQPTFDEKPPMRKKPTIPHR